LARAKFDGDRRFFHRRIASGVSRRREQVDEAFMEASMENLGMLSLGSFAGGVLCLGLPLKPEDFKTEELMKVTYFVLSTAITLRRAQRYRCFKQTPLL
jgi:hypothetical protein